MRRPVRGPGASLSRRSVCLGLVSAVLSLPLAGCGDSEPDQRKAFIAFLKDRIVDKPGIHLPVPTDDERKSFGPYAAQFDVIADFNHTMDAAAQQTIGGFSNLMGQANSVGALLSHKDEIVQLKDGVGKFRDALQQKLDAANAARAALPAQPDDLKPVYAAAFERDVSQPAALFLEAAPVMQQTLGSLLDVIAFIDQHKGVVTVNGTMVNTSDPKLAPQLNALLQAVNENAQKAQALFQKAQAMAYGQ